MKQVSTVAIFHKNNILMGVRRDVGKWTMPGGHLNAGETPLEGAVREVKEEAGLKLDPEGLRHLGTEHIKKPDGTEMLIHGFEMRLHTAMTPDHTKDPDKEVFGWNWVPVQGKSLPESVKKNLHVPAKDNVLIHLLGFEKKLHEKTPRH